MTPWDKPYKDLTIFISTASCHSTWKLSTFDTSKDYLAFWALINAKTLILKKHLMPLFWNFKATYSKYLSIRLHQKVLKTCLLNLRVECPNHQGYTHLFYFFSWKISALFNFMHKIKGVPSNFVGNCKKHVLIWMHLYSIFGSRNTLKSNKLFKINK